MKTQPAYVKVTQFDAVSLQNDGSKIEVYAIGHGAARSTTNTSFIAVVGETSLLIDCGHAIPAAFVRFGVNPAAIKNYFITHAHGDHVGGLASPLIENRYFRGSIPGAKATLWAPRIWAKDLWNNSLSGDLSSHDSPSVLKDVGGDNLKTLPSNHWYDILLPKEEGSFAGRDVYRFERDGLKVEAFRTMHTPATVASWQESAWSTGVLINDLIWISGDTRFDPSLIKSYASRSKVMIHDASPFPKDLVHAPFDSLVTRPVDEKSKMFLTHLPSGFDGEDTQKMVKSKGFWGLALAGTKFSAKL